MNLLALTARVRSNMSPVEHQIARFFAREIARAREDEQLGRDAAREQVEEMMCGTPVRVEVRQMEIRGMTSERLMEAIRAHDPDGEGRARVVAAARRTLSGQGLHQLRADNANACVLAFGWESAFVADDLFRSLGVEIASCQYPSHVFADVMLWFDSFVEGCVDSWQRDAGNRAAAEAVLTLLGAKEPE